MALDAELLVRFRLDGTVRVRIDVGSEWPKKLVYKMLVCRCSNHRNFFSEQRVLSDFLIVIDTLNWDVPLKRDKRKLFKLSFVARL